MSQGYKSLRFSALKSSLERTPKKYDHPKDPGGRALRISDYFGVNTFDLHKMKDKLPKDIYSKLIKSIRSGQTVSNEVALSVAHAAKEWALANGVTHFCHWFQPMTGTTAEKHDAFLSFDGHRKTVELFSASMLIQSEPDASSFPSGGMRTTFEARGYTGWDPSSPMFIMESANGKTLCIPSVFIGYHGEAQDERTGLLRSSEIISNQAKKLLELLGEKAVSRVIPTLGPEQEYFLIDRSFYQARPDLIMCGRTLIGARPPKGQQLEDHYFGSIPARVQAFMSESEFELYKLGVPTKTRHNEVAPSQYECAPIFEEADLATDHNHLTMEIMRKVAKRHQFEILFHEKPFAGINGTGKHCNWSLSAMTGESEYDSLNLLDPGKTPQQNIRFLMFLVAVLKGVHKNGGLLRAAIASVGNDHRLGANEAPPAIISVFLGEQLSRILDSIEKGTASEGGEAAMISLGVSKLPEIMKDNTDRNRTSPFAFTGNKFEFRAVGGSANVAFPVTIVNAAVAEGIREVTEALQTQMSKKKDPSAAALEVIRQFAKETRAIRFEGNNYSAEWVVEAEKRGLPNLRKSPEAIAQLINPAHEKMLVDLGVFSKTEIHSRYHVMIETYVKRMMIEASTLKMLVDTYVLPASFRYYAELTKGVQSAKSAGLPAIQSSVAEEVAQLIAGLKGRQAQLDTLIQRIDNLTSEDAKAKMLSSEMTAAMDEVRAIADRLEEVVADDFWPLPKYREMLFAN